MCESRASEALSTFARLLKAQNVAVVATHPNGIETGPVSVPGSPQQVRYRALVQPTEKGSVLLIAGYRVSPASGDTEQIKVTRTDDQGFAMMASMISQGYDNSQIRHARNVPDIVFD